MAREKLFFMGCLLLAVLLMIVYEMVCSLRNKRMTTTAPTTSEPMPFKPGDRVLITRDGLRGKRQGVVRSIWKHRWLAETYWVAIRRDGMKKLCHYPAKDVELVERASANIYADFLDEHGETTAAELLRRHFPLG